MVELKMPDGIKPFCPVHHWRMAYDSGSSKVSLSFRCGYEACSVRYTPSDGYFKTGKAARDADFLLSVEAIPCKHDREHHPCVVGYAKESHGERTEEWRNWQCPAEKCDFSLRQQLSPAEPTGLLLKHRKRGQRQSAYAER